MAGLSTSETIVAFDDTKSASLADSSHSDGNNDKAAAHSRSPKRRSAGGSSKSPKRLSSKRSPMRSASGKARSPKKSPKKRVSPMRGADAPVDIAGRSPYGAMATSAQGLARTNRKALEGALYSPDDPSVRGDVAPARGAGEDEEQRLWTAGQSDDVTRNSED